LYHLATRKGCAAMVKGAAMISSLGIRTAATLFALSGAAFGQNLESDVAPITSAIAYIPPLAQAVLLHDPEKVSQALETGAKVDEAVRAKDQARAGFTPLILAAALSEPYIAKMLIGHGSSITVLDDFHRSAFWYAALRGDVEVTEVLVGASGVSDVINAADHDLQRTPLHIAVRGNEKQLVSLLLKFGASSEQKDILGETPGDYCKRHGTEACKALP
jgi:ankyrin repeat protein